MIENWKKLVWKLWSIRLALLLAAISGLYSVWPAFNDLIPPVAFAMLAMLMSMVIVGARLTKQKGLEDEE